MIITISGKPCTGKSTMAEIFVKKYFLFPPSVQAVLDTPISPLYFCEGTDPGKLLYSA